MTRPGRRWPAMTNRCCSTRTFDSGVSAALRGRISGFADSWISGEFRGFDYYDGVVFDVFTEGIGAEVGGRRTV